jgi:uncharacterized protein
MKYLIWALLIYLAWRWYSASKQSHADQSAADDAHAARAVNGAETMVRCVRCDVYLPASEALIEAGGAVFCSEEHRGTHSPS